MLITISGTPGAGKGTAAALLSKKLDIPAYSIGDIQRSLAEARGMTLEQFGRYEESHPSVDREVDRWQRTMAKKLKRGIFEGRVSYHFVPNSIKIYLSCSLLVGAQRLRSDPNHKRRHEGDFSTLKKTEATLRRRMASERKRYQAYYGLDIHDPLQYDFALNTNRLSTHQIVQKIIKFIKNANLSQKVEKQGKSGKSKHK